MKRKEFIEQVGKSGFRVTEIMDCLAVVKHGMPVLEVFEDEIYSINTTKAQFDNLAEADRKQLFTLATEYAATPLEEREEEKHFRVIKELMTVTNGLRKTKLHRLEKYSFYRSGKPNIDFTLNLENGYVFDDIETAQIFATLVDGEVEEV